MELNKIIQGDCLEVLPTLSDNSVDSIVTDPPYELGFMGKSWDNTGIANNVKMWKECLRVLKPGGHLLSFSGTRTYHRMACAIEDAGFEVRDMIEWVYGSGFPKSLNIGKVTDKFLKTGNASWNGTGDSSNGALGYSKLQHKQDYRPEDYSNRHQNKDNITEEKAKQWEGWGTALKPAHEPICMARKPLSEKTVAENVLKYGTGGINIEQSRVLTQDDEVRKQKILAGEVVCNAFCDKHGLYPSSFHDIVSFSPLQLLDFLEHTFSEQDLGNISYISSLRNLGEIDYKNCKQLLGVPCDYGRLEQRVDEYVRQSLQSLDFLSDYPTLYRLCGVYSQSKRAYDLDVFPLDSDVRADINRFLSLEESILLCDNNLPLVFVLVCLAYSLLVNNNLHNHYTTCKNKKQAGRFPANLIHDNSEEVRECFPETTTNGVKTAFVGGASKGINIGGGNVKPYETNSGNASRFFKSIIYQAKSSKADRNSNGAVKNTHPTVKSVALMEYLIKMVTPKGGIVLDPFAGSGSTLVAAKENGFQFIGIEMTPDYIPIIEARTGVKAEGMVVEVKEEIKEVKQKDICNCGGQIKKVDGGRMCELCMKEY